MHFFNNIFQIIFKTRFVLFLFVFLVCLDSIIIVYLPKYRVNHHINIIRNSFADHFNVISDVINRQVDNDAIPIQKLISYLKFHPDLKYFGIANANDTVIYPPEFISMERIKAFSDKSITNIKGQQILSLKLIPDLKYQYDFKLYYAGLNADRIIDKQMQAKSEAVLFIIITILLFMIFTALYFLDMYKPLTKLDLWHSKSRLPDLYDDKTIINGNGVIDQKSRLVTRKKELKSINNILVATIKSQRNFIRVISHDLKAPLRNISGLVDSIYRKYPDNLNKDISDRLSRIKNNIDKEREIVSDILLNITSQKNILSYEKIDLQKIIESILDGLDFEIQHKNIEVIIKENLPIVYSNRIVLKHVFQNLLDNACKFFPENGFNRLEVGCIETDSNHVFSIKDTGPGIPPELQKTLNNTFEYSQSLSTVDNIDSGLGLQLVHTFLEIVNGKIWFESEVDKGSAFYVSLNKLDDTKAGIFQ